MVSRIFTKRVVPLAKQFVRQSHEDTSGIVGSNLPFGIKNKLALTIGFAIYTGSAMTLPFYVALHNMEKKL